MEICSYTFVDPQAVPLNQLQFGFDLKLVDNVKWPNKLIEKWTVHANQSFQLVSSLVANPKKKVQQSYLNQGC